MRTNVSGCTLFATWIVLVQLCSAYSGNSNQRQQQHFPRTTPTTVNYTPAQHFYAVPQYRRPRPGPRQIPYQLTQRRCRSRRFRSLRACHLDPDQASELASGYLCQTRDIWTPQEEQQSHSVSKRSVNACGGTRIRQAILEAVDNEGNLRELVIDRANNLYQTILVETCSTFGGVSGLSCLQHPITFKAAVFDLDPNSNDISVIDVSTDGYCALSF